jgi:hypothetical protein
MLYRGSGVPYAAASLIKPSEYEIGDVLRLGRKTFVLAKSGGVISDMGMGVKNGLPQGVAHSAIAVAADAGAVAVTVTTSATAGQLGTGAIAVDEFKDGEIILFSTGTNTPPQRRGIIGNTARVATGSLPVTFYLDSPLTTALTISDYAEAMQSEYSYVVQDTQIGNPVVGVPMVLAAAANMYLWLQTWGRCFCSTQPACGIAGATGLYWRHDGSLDVENADAYVSDQYAGFVLAETPTHTQAAPFFQLQIVP